MSSHQRGTKLASLFTQRIGICNGSQITTLRCWSSSSASSTGRVAVLPSRGVVHAEGPQLLAFLQGLVSNDVRPLQSPGPHQPPVYATILTPKGKFLHDVFIHPHPEQKDAVLLDVDRNGLPDVLQLLNRYKLRRPITLRDASGEFRVAACWGAASPPAGPWWRPDPRLKELGFRAVLPASESESAALGDAGSRAGEEDFRSLRYSLGVAEGETEIPSGQAAPLDFNVDVLNGVSYTKGCYVGQERNSFTHYRGIIRKRLMPVRLEEMRPGAAAAPLPPLCAEVVEPATGKSIGQIRGVSAVPSASSSSSSSSAHSSTCTAAPAPQHPPPSSPAGSSAPGSWHWGIAYLRLDSALQAAEGRFELGATSQAAPGDEEGKAAAAGRDRVQGRVEGGDDRMHRQAQGGGWRVVPVRPAWWPSAWGREEAGSRAGGS